jgi:streptomycin 6-kinase
VRAAHARLLARHGPGVDAWFEALPRRTAELAERWGLELGEPIPRGNTSLLLRCTREGRAGVLKLSPEPALAAEEARALRAWGPTGRAPEVWEHEGDALLLEAIEPGIALSDGARRPARDELATLLEGLHAAPADGFPPLAERVEFVFEHWIGRSSGERAAALRGGHVLARELAGTYDGPPVLVHGDLHLANVLESDRGLIAIDPRACAGDPAFDAVDFVLRYASGGRELDARVEELAPLAGGDPERLAGWCRAFAPMVAHLTTFL